MSTVHSKILSKYIANKFETEIILMKKKMFDTRYEIVWKTLLQVHMRTQLSSIEICWWQRI